MSSTTNKFCSFCYKHFVNFGIIFIVSREEKAAAAAKSGGGGESSESALATLGTSMPPTATSTPGVNPFTGKCYFSDFCINSRDNGLIGGSLPCWSSAFGCEVLSSRAEFFDLNFSSMNPESVFASA